MLPEVLNSMKNDLVFVHHDDIVIGTYKLSKGFGTTHQAVKKLVTKYHDRFERVGKRHIGQQILVSQPGFEIRAKQQKKRIQELEFLLNEEQAMYLGTLLRNSDTVLDFKEKLVTEFRRMYKFLMSMRNQKQNTEWLEKRASGKIERRIETDSIKEFIEYSKNQGSTNAEKYYVAITKMENNALFHLDLITCKYSNLRNLVNGMALDVLKMADRIVEKALIEGMKKIMYYKDIYRMAKSRIETFADHLGKMHIDDNGIENRKITGSS